MYLRLLGTQRKELRSEREWIATLMIKDWIGALGLLAFALPMTLAKAQPASQYRSIKHDAIDSENENCVIMPSTRLPVLKWCETEDAFRYEITSWKETRTFQKSVLLENSRSAVQAFLQPRCDTPELRYDSARLEIWLTVPRSGAELAVPRLGVQMSSAREAEKNLHLVFGNGWDEEWSANLENLFILGTRSYDQFSGEEMVGSVPGSLLLRPISEANGRISDATTRDLQELGVRVTRRLQGSLPIYQAEAPIFRELDTVTRVKMSEVYASALKWIETNARVEAIGDKFLLYSEPLPEFVTLCP